MMHREPVTTSSYSMVYAPQHVCTRHEFYYSHACLCDGDDDDDDVKVNALTFYD